MANIKQQKKRILITTKENQNNTMKRSRVKKAIRTFEKAIKGNDLKLAKELLPKTEKIINMAKSDGVYHQNNASRKITRINKLFNQANNQKTQ